MKQLLVGSRQQFLAVEGTHRVNHQNRVHGQDHRSNQQPHKYTQVDDPGGLAREKRQYHQHQRTALGARKAAERLYTAVRKADTVARLGGDEFSILLNDCPLEKARQIADDVMRAVADYSFVWNDKSLSLTVSVGLVEVARNSESMPDVMRHADTACFRAKKQGGGRVVVYSAR